MGSLASGQVVLLLYPFSDLSRSKKRPAVLLASAGYQDWIVCQITSNPFHDVRALSITDSDFESGGLHHESYVRPGKVFTAHESLIDATLGELKPLALDRFRDAVIDILRQS